MTRFFLSSAESHLVSSWVNLRHFRGIVGWLGYDKTNRELRSRKGDTSSRFIIKTHLTVISILLTAPRTFSSCCAAACRVIGVPVSCAYRAAISVGLAVPMMREQRHRA
jgi:hypothetical protein